MNTATDTVRIPSNLSAGTEADSVSSVLYFTPESVFVDHTRNQRWSAENADSSHTAENIQTTAQAILMASGRYDSTQPATAMIVVSPEMIELHPELATLEGEEIENFIHGQLQAGGFHYESDPADASKVRPALRYGFGRYEAINLINNNPVLFADLLMEKLGLTPDDIEGGDFTYTIGLRNRTGIDPMMDNVIENGARVHLSDMDWAKICQSLRHPAGSENVLSTAEIAAMLAPMKPVKDGAPSSSWVEQHLELLRCSPRLQALVHLGANNGGCSVWQALNIRRNANKVAKSGIKDETPVDDDAQEKVAMDEMDRQLDSMTDKDGAFSMKAARQTNRASAEQTGAPATHTITEAKKILKVASEEYGSKIAKTVLGWLEGKISDKKLDDLFAAATVENADAEVVKAAKQARKSKKTEEPATDAKTGARLPAKVTPEKAAANAKKGAKKGAAVEGEATPATGKKNGGKGSKKDRPAAGEAAVVAAADLEAPEDATPAA